MDNDRGVDTRIDADQGYGRNLMSRFTNFVGLTNAAEHHVMITDEEPEEPEASVEAVGILASLDVRDSNDGNSRHSSVE